MTGPSDNFFMRYATAIAIGTVTFLMLLIATVIYQQDATASTARNWVNHTYEVKGHIQSLLNKLEDGETGERGYMFSGDTKFLQPYEEALQSSSDTRQKSDALNQHHSIAEEIDILRRLTSDNPIEQQNLDDMDRGVRGLLDYFTTSIETRKANDATASLQKIDFREGKELMDHLRDLISRMELEEDHLLILRTQADDATARQNSIMALCRIGIFYVLMVLSISIYQRTRTRTQAELISYMQQLERNEEELKMQQEELKASNEEIETSNEELEEQNAQIRQQAEELARAKQLTEEQAREVAQASKYKSEFLANMSHELRTPLNSLLILARSLASNEEGNLTKEQMEEAHIIHNDGLELLNLINDILDLSKVEAGKLNIVIEDISTSSIAEHLRQQFTPIAKQSGVDFPVDLEAGLPEALRTDVQRVEQILKNLLSNAFKFTSQGSVSLRVHYPDAGEQFRGSFERNNAIAFSVIDTGIGIEPSKFKDIFEAFQQEDGSTERHYGGTGLGLTIARKFAHLLGGEIHVASTKGIGSTFTLVLPINPSAQSSGEKVITANEAPANDFQISFRPIPSASVTEFIADDRKNITNKDKVMLIIEDDRNFASTLMKIARKRGFKCLAASTGKTGLMLAVENPVTAIILDLKLPDIDGLQVLDQLKYDLRSRYLPVHIITGHADSDQAAFLRKGAMGYLAKPVQQENLDAAFTKIENLLQASVKQLLLVEEDAENLNAIQGLLEKKDCRITSVRTGTSALDHLKAQPFDCVILDLSLPDMAGLDWLAQAEKELGRKGLPPIIVYTAKELTENENRLLSNYTDSVIIKGVKSPERLLDEVTLFLHSVESSLSKEQRDMIRMQHDPDKVLRTKTALLVDDDLRNTFALSKLLKKHGMNVVIADNGQMALDKLRENPTIDAVMMDIMMPVMDGYQAIMAIRALPSQAHLPIIALTARAMPEEQEKCMAAGANDYLTKPVDVERLLTLLRVCLFKQEMVA